MINRGPIVCCILIFASFLGFLGNSHSVGGGDVSGRGVDRRTVLGFSTRNSRVRYNIYDIYGVVRRLSHKTFSQPRCTQFPSLMEVSIGGILSSKNIQTVFGGFLLFSDVFFVPRREFSLQ